MDCNHQAQYRDSTVVNTVMNLRLHTVRGTARLPDEFLVSQERPYFLEVFS
jgi:hypothetical protein